MYPSYIAVVVMLDAFNILTDNCKVHVCVFTDMLLLWIFQLSGLTYIPIILKKVYM